MSKLRHKDLNRPTERFRKFPMSWPPEAKKARRSKGATARAQMLSREQLADGSRMAALIEAVGPGVEIPARSLISAASTLGVRIRHGQWWLRDSASGYRRTCSPSRGIIAAPIIANPMDCLFARPIEGADSRGFHFKKQQIEKIKIDLSQMECAVAYLQRVAT